MESWGLLANDVWSVLLERNENSGLKMYRGASFVTAFFLIGLAAEFSPALVPYLSLGIVPMDLLLRTKTKRQNSQSWQRWMPTG